MSQKNNCAGKKIIPTSFGQTLTWEYWQYAVKHPIMKWDSPTRILYGEHDHMIDYRVAENFSKISLYDDSYDARGALVPHRAADELPGTVDQQ